MVENLQALCETVDDNFGWKLRGVLQSEPQIMLLATTTSRFKGLTSRFKGAGRCAGAVLRVVPHR